MLQRYGIARRLPKLYQGKRRLATNASGSGGSAVAIGAAVVFGGGAITIGAAWKYPNFRKSVEQNVPPLVNLFNPLLGPLENDAVLLPPKPSASKKQKKTEDFFEAPLKEVRKKEEAETLKELDPEPQDEVLKEHVQKIDENAIPIAIDDGTAVPPPPPIEIQPVSSKEKDLGEVQALSKDEPTTVLSDNSSQLLDSNVMEEKKDTDEKASEESESFPVSVERTPEEVERQLAKLEQEALQDESLISSILEEKLSSCASRCSDAIETNNEASKAISLHTSLLKSAMSDGKEGNDENSSKWVDMSRVLEQKERLQSEAESISQDARQELMKIDEVISQYKDSSSSTIKQKVLQIEEICNEMRKDLEESAKDINVKLSESHVISQYKDLVDNAKEQFRQELLSIVPDVKIESGWRKLSQKLSHDDLNALIAHAHRRVDQLQRELAEERSISINRVAMAVKSAREKWDESATIETNRKIEVLKREYEIQHEKKLEQVRQTFEDEMRVQLKRQAAAHSDHLAEVLGIQKDQLERELRDIFANQLDEQEKKCLQDKEVIESKYENEKKEMMENYQFKLNKALARVAGIETAVDGRAYVQNESRKAQELWLACEALRVAVQYGESGSLKPLQSEVQAIVNVPGVDSHVQDILKSFPEQALRRGVFTEDALRSAYKQVSKICRRVSLIDETRNSFYDYFLSYLKSLLIINRAQTEPPSELDIQNLDTFKILSYAKYSLQKGDLEQAARFINQLTGEPKRMAEGWLEEARLLLETRQIVEVLSSMASATSIAANIEA